MNTAYKNWVNKAGIAIKRSCFTACLLSLLLIGRLAFAEAIQGPNGMKIDFSLTGASISSFSDVVSGGLVARKIDGVHSKKGLITVSGSASIPSGGKPTRVSSRDSNGLLFSMSLGQQPNPIYSIPFYSDWDSSRGGDYTLELIMEEWDDSVRPPQYTGNVLQVTFTFKPEDTPSCNLQCGRIQINPNPGIIGQKTQFSITPTATGDCPTEQNTYWNFGDGKTSAGLNNTSVSWQYDYADTFKITAVYQRATYTTKFECYAEDYLSIGDSGGGGGGGGDTKVYPNLAPFKPKNWSDKIVVSNKAGTNTDDNPLYTTDTLSVDWAVLNRSDVAIDKRFYTSLYLDGNLKYSWYTDSLLNNYYANVIDYSLGSLASGTHTLEIRADVNDAIREADETDNMFTKTFQVFPAQNNNVLPNLRPHQAKGWSSPIVLSTRKNTFTDTVNLSDSDTVYAAWAIANDGAVGVNKKFYTSFYRDGVKLGTWNTAALGVNKAAGKWNLNLGRLLPGNHEVKLVVDSTSAINESKEYDNEFTKNIYVDGYSYYAPPPDLTFFNPEDGTAPVKLSKKVNGADTDTFSIKDKVYVSWSIKNMGEGAVTKKFNVKIYVDDKIMKTLSVNKLNAGEVFTKRNISIGKLAAENKTISLLIDPDNFLEEDSKTNNQYSRSLNMTCEGCGL